MKRLLKQVLRRCGFALRRVRPSVVNGIELADDLAALLPQARPCCIDGGANDGATITLLHRCLHRPVIHAFEPNPTIFASLQANHARTPDLRLVNAGLAEAEGTLTLNCYRNHALNSFLPLTAAGRGCFAEQESAQPVSVPVLRIDDYARANAIERIDLLKIDTQGFELHVLRGAERLFAIGAVGAVLVELDFATLYEAQAAPADVFAFLQRHDLHLVDLYEKCRRDSLLGWSTALFARPTAAPR